MIKIHIKIYILIILHILYNVNIKIYILIMLYILYNINIKIHILILIYILYNINIKIHIHIYILIYMCICVVIIKNKRAKQVTDVATSKTFDVSSDSSIGNEPL